MSLTLSVALSVLMASPAPAGFEQSGPFSVEADRLVALRKSGRYVAEGQAVLRRQGLVVYADRLEFDESTNRVVAHGHVVVVDGTSVFTCSRIELSVPELAGSVANAELRIKKGLSHSGLSRVPKDKLTDHGRDELIVKVAKAKRKSAREVDIEGGSFTPCDCGDDARPSWRIDAKTASIDMDKGAWLTWPVFYVKDIPVLALPAFYVPLGPRRTGLLAPRPGYSSITGFVITQPIYFTFGRSWDATLDLTYMTSRGPAPKAELRWAPSSRTQGQVNLTFLADWGVRSTDGRSYSFGRDDPLYRWALAGKHLTQLDSGKLAVDLNLASDPSFTAEFGDEFLQRQAEYSTSRATHTFSMNSGVRVATGLALRQDLRALRYLGAADFREVNLFSDDPGPGEVRYRFLELRADAPPTPMSGPFIGEATISAQGFIAPFPQQPRFARFDFRPSVRAPISIFDRAVFEPSVALRLGGWSGRSRSESLSATRVAAVAKTALFTEIWRDFGDVVHRIRPEVAHVIIEPFAGSGPGEFDTADEIDLLARAHQVAGRIETDLWSKKRNRRMFRLAATLGRDLDLGDHEGVGTSPLVIEADTTFSLFSNVVGVTLSSLTSIELSSKVVAEQIAGASVRVGPWFSISSLFGDFASNVPRRTFVAPEEFVPSATIPTSGYLDPTAFGTALAAARSIERPGATEALDISRWESNRVMTLGGSFSPWTPLTLGFGLAIDLKDLSPTEMLVQDQTVVTPSRLRTLSGSLAFESPCECWGAVLLVSKNRDRTFPDINVAVDLARLGSVSTP